VTRNKKEKAIIQQRENNSQSTTHSIAAQQQQPFFSSYIYSHRPFQQTTQQQQLGSVQFVVAQNDDDDGAHKHTHTHTRNSGLPACLVQQLVPVDRSLSLSVCAFICADAACAILARWRLVAAALVITVARDESETHTLPKPQKKNSSARKKNQTNQPNLGKK
jgi:hypothetical protein